MTKIEDGIIWWEFEGLSDDVQDVVVSSKKAHRPAQSEDDYIIETWEWRSDFYEDFAADAAMTAWQGAPILTEPY